MGDYGIHGIVPERDCASMREEQPLSDEKRAFVRSIYALFESFKNASREYLEEIQTARAFRRLDDPGLDSPNAPAKRPQLNTLNSTMDNMIADYVDNMPEVILAPERVDLEDISRQMTDVLGWVFHHAELPAVWKLAVDDAVVTGTGVIQDFFDPSMSGGGEEGNISLISWPPESWLPDPLYEDFQQGRAVFKVCKHPMSYFAQHYPDIAQYISAAGDSVMDYGVDGDNKRTDINYGDPSVALLEVWYRRFDPDNERYAIHMAKVAGNCLLEDSRDNPETASGVYAHGQYPFTSIRFRKRRGTAYGAGMCHEYADTQRMINLFMGYINDNIRESAKFKMLISKQAGVDMKALMDYNQQVVLVDQRINKEMMDWQQPRPLNSLAPTMMSALQDTMKQDSGQNQFTRGEGGLGVTAASAINMLQNAGSKISRMHVNDFINDFRHTCDRIISMIGQFFKEKRIFMIYGEQGGSDMREVEFDPQKVFDGMEPYKKPAFSVRVMAQRSSPDQVEAFNQKVLRMVELSANSNPIPPVAIAKMLQMTGKEQMVPILESVDAQRQAMLQMQQQIETLSQQLQAVAGENEQLKQGLDQAAQEIQQQQQVMAAVGQQMTVNAQAQSPSMPT
jgi:hypothetical protein